MMMMTLHRKNKSARQNWPGEFSYLLLGVMAGIILTSLSGCQLERFRHEKYSCQNSNLDIAEIIIRNAKKGKEVKIFGYDGERTGIIENISSQLAIIRTEDGTLRLNRKTGALSIKRRNRYTRTNCKLSVFTL
jgi:hypothetical protein